jgi:hypothetical protein
MRRARLGTMATVALLTRLLACESLGGLSAGDDTTDAGQTSVAPESGSPDASPDAIDASDAAGAATTFATSFDDAGLAGWTSVKGSVGTDNAESVSPPSSMMVTGGTSEAFVSKLLDGSWVRVRCTFELMFSASADIEVVYVSILSPSTSQQGYGVAMHVGPSTAGFYEGWNPDGGARYVTSTPIAAPAANEWVAAEIDLDLEAHDAFVRLGSVSMHRAIAPPTPVTGMQLDLGATFIGSTSTWTLRYDDLRCDAW